MKAQESGLRATIIRKIRYWERSHAFSKRQEFVVVTVILTIGILLTQIVPVEFRYPIVGFLSLLAYGLCALVLRQDLKGIEWITLLVLPAFFTGGVSLFYFLLPARWLTRVPVVVFYVVGMYALLLTENIYNVAANRTIALLRAAHSVGFLLTLISYFLITQTILVFRFPIIFQILLVGIVSFLLVFQSLWAYELEGKASKRVWDISIGLTVALVQISWVFAFWPVNRTLVALLLTTFLYSCVGVAQQYLVDRLYKKTFSEFFSVLGIVFIVVLFATHWRGLN